jgi:hypothetical protein
MTHHIQKPEWELMDEPLHYVNKEVIPQD